MAYKIGGPDQVRTDDLLNAIEALFQLSYEPIRTCEKCEKSVFPCGTQGVFADTVSCEASNSTF